ncbi:MAG: GNAT family N-acetyltransferase [Hyphomicrobiales bacterium]
MDLRPIRDDELEEFARTQAAGFGYDYRPEALGARRAIFEADRSTAAFDGPEMVGTAGIFSFEMTLPGAVAPVAGVTMVSVKPTHRRRGILTAMMGRQLREIRERGEAVAALWASESLIYGRFGYGLSSQNADWTIDRTRTALQDGAEPRGSVRLVSVEEALASWPAVYDRERVQQPGFYSRSRAWWEQRVLRDPEWARGGMTQHFRASYEEGGAVRGFVLYRIRGEYRDWLPSGSVHVVSLVAETAEAYTALWRYVFGIDLVATIEAEERSVDEPLYWMLTDPRRLQRRLHDALWLRIVDVPAALAARRYSVEGRVVFEVDDPFVPEWGGRFALEGGPDGAVCRATTETAEVRLSARDLGALYMGSQSVLPLAAAGRVLGDDGVLRRVDAMFRWAPAAWCPEVF